jgi:hypothetical protein
MPSCLALAKTSLQGSFNVDSDRNRSIVALQLWSRQFNTGWVVTVACKYLGWCIRYFIASILIDDRDTFGRSQGLPGP